MSFSRAGGFIRALEVFSLIVTFQSLDVRLVALVAGGEQCLTKQNIHLSRSCIKRLKCPKKEHAVMDKTSFFLDEIYREYS